MRIIYGEIGKSFKSDKPLVATMGNFDGVHLGHQALINECQQEGKKSIVFTFDPHPNCIIKSSFEYFVLSSIENKIEMIRDLKPDYLYIIKFDIKAASATKDEVIEWMKSMNVEGFVCGEDFHFGYKALGTIDDLRKSFNCTVLPNILLKNTRISSTLIRDLIYSGNIKAANQALGHYYSMDGVVIHGNNLGNKIGFPTANIDIFGHQVPKKGVYAVKVFYQDKYYYGMANIGNNPTFNFTMNMRLEVHIFDFNYNIYGCILKIYFIDFIREEKKFSSSEELINELRKNKKQILQEIEERKYEIKS